MTYNIGTPADIQVLSESYVSSDSVTNLHRATCPAIELEVLNSNGTPLDSAVFTFTPGTSTFEIETDDSTKVATYNLKVTAKYTGDPEFSIDDELSFTVTIADPVGSAC